MRKAAAPSRIIDVSRRAAQLLGFERAGTTTVNVRILMDESIKVAAPRDEVWLIVSDPSGYPQFMRGVSFGSVEGEPPVGHRARYTLWKGVTILNVRHDRWAWVSMFTVWGTDVYIRLLMHGVLPHAAWN